jgi:hypothetical protein
MRTLSIEDVTQYVEENIGIFHQKKIDSLNRLNLRTVLKKKNPYLFRAKNCLTAEQIVKGLVDAFIFSNEETIFGDWLEGLSLFMNGKVYAGWKSGITGIDLEFDNNNIRYIVAVKSGPNWGNSSQIAKMKSDFLTANRAIRTSNSGLHVVAVNGCCYGLDRKPDKGDYFKYCGQDFWQFISGNDRLFVDIIEPLGHDARNRNDLFNQSFANMVNLFTREFSTEFCNARGAIMWNKFVEFNSGRS